MIVSPDFLNHWKLTALAHAIGTLEAITSLLHLWAYCQTRKTWVDAFPAPMLAGICKFSGDPQLLRKALIECRWLDELEDGRLEVHDWAETNNSLVIAWNNGRKRTAGKPTGNPQDTQSDPTGNPPDTCWGSDKIGLDKIREEKSREDGKPGLPAAAGVSWTPESGWTGITPDLRAQLEKSFPGRDLDTECNKADLWLRENPGKAAKFRKFYSFLTNWLGKASPSLPLDGPAGPGEKKEGGPPDHPTFTAALSPAPAGPWRACYQDLYSLPEVPATAWSSLAPAIQREIRQALSQAQPLETAAWEAVEKKDRPAA